MLRRLKTSSDAGQTPIDAQSEAAQAASEQNGDDGPMSSLQKYRSQTMKDYGLMIEYKHLRQHVPSGIYVLPSFDQSRIWYGTIFIHAGLYRNGIFKFTIFLPESYNGPGTYPRIVFNTGIFHPYVFQDTKELDLKPKFPEWDPELHYMVAVLTYLKGIFYMKDFPELSTVANSTALDMFRHDPENYVNNVEASVEESLENVYNNEQGSTIRFTKHNPAHDNLRQELFAQLDAAQPAAPQTLEEKMAGPPATRSLSIVTAAAAEGAGEASNDTAMGSQEDEARLNERISKARTELSELHKIMAKDDRSLFRESEGPAARTRSRTTGATSSTHKSSSRDATKPSALETGLRTPQAPRSASGERLMQLSRTEDTVRTDRMRLAELSDEHKWQTTAEKESAARSGRARMSPVGRVRANTTPRRTTAKDLGDYSKDYVQQALNFDDVVDDGEDAAIPPSPPRSERLRSLGDPGQGVEQETGEFGGARTHQDLRTYVHQMEETIAQLVQQKDELLRNQAEFDKHASGIFPSLENLNHQLSQIVQGKMLQSGHSQNNDDVANLHEDMLDELRVQREQLSELEADGKRRKYDAELQEQSRAIEISQIKGEIIGLVASGKMRDERSELLVDTVKELQEELRDSVKNMVQRHQQLDKRINQLQTPMTQPRLLGRKSQRNTLLFAIAVLLGFIAVALGFIIMNSGDCGLIAQCHPLT
ncbi:hypothetical protein JM18_004164 [Phytophthora kernoviae]|uniref:UBC core domain-containing protein n=2 Tax=Phytophthora kernoviae TaxID=325452 RepID=A0A8T0M045_9STRA|nr:hypothetical protein G195_006140 [Phytophthora kernoviae 00238/432]KAG2523178.1 hypothetical protein JM18_004164 [Phytophthora kernoviae]KAG2525161.1 hypothetical protein JM16_004624 [Phytophthora kernoviae]